MQLISIELNDIKLTHLLKSLNIHVKSPFTYSFFTNREKTRKYYRHVCLFVLQSFVVSREMLLPNNEQKGKKTIYLVV